MTMDSSRFKILAGVGSLFVIALMGYWISGWGTITLNVDKVPLSKVLKSIERQGNIKIVTNADPATPVSLNVRRAPVFDVLDTLAIRLDGSAQLAYVAAPDHNAITNVFAAFQSGANPGGWSVFSAGFGGRSMDPEGITPDPRLIKWKVTSEGGSSLQTLFEQGAQKTGILFATPEGWNPTVSKLPKEGQTGAVASALTKAAKGQIEEVFLLTVRPPQTEEPTAEEGRWRAPPTVFSSARRGQERNPEWMAERAAAQIATLPADQQADAQKRFDEMQALWKGMRDLSPEDRRKKIEELMNNPEIQARMEEYRAARDAKRTPEQREQRMKKYIERKERMKNTPAAS